MNSTLRTILPAFLIAVGQIGIVYAAPQSDDPMSPDRLLLKDGRRLEGLIVSNTADAVTIQKSHMEYTVPKSEILRIFDEDDSATYFSQPQRSGSLPPWRVIANDMRVHDRIRTFEQIPATVIDNGEYRNVPYLSFRINGDVELNIYGDPDDPAAVEVGTYGARRNNDQLKTMLRQYLAGYLTTREEIGALYKIPLSGGERRAGGMRLSITPPDAPDAYGAWWVSVSNPAALEKVRLNDAEYARLVTPMKDVFDRNGKVLDSAWTGREVSLSRRASRSDGNAEVFLRGFYRDAEGRFQLVYDTLTGGR